MGLFRKTEIVWCGPRGGKNVLMHIRHVPNQLGKLLGFKTKDCKYVSEYGHMWYRLPDMKYVGLYDHDHGILDRYSEHKRKQNMKRRFANLLEE